MFDILNENTSTKKKVKDFNEVKNIIADLQNEIKIKIKEKIDQKTIQPELRSRVKEFIDIDNWKPQIDYTVIPCTKEKKTGIEDEYKGNAISVNDEVDLYNILKKVVIECIKELCNNQIKLADNQKKYKFKNQEKNEEICKSCEDIESSCKFISKILEPFDIEKKSETITECYLEFEIRDTLQTINDKIDKWIEELISVAQYPYLKRGVGVKTIVEELGKILEYGNGCEQDNRIIERIHRILQWNFNYKEVECTGAYELRDFFIEEIKDDVDKNSTTRKAMILEDKYAENPLIIKGHVIIPSNSSANEE